MINAPYTFLQENLYNASFSPSTIHGDSDMAAYFARYLFQKAISPFKFTLPDSWPLNYFLYTIYAAGVGCVFNAGKFGVAFQQCTLEGLNLYYQPRKAIVANPVLQQEYPGRSWDMMIGEECSVIKLQPDYHGILDIISYYADIMAMFSSTLATSLINSRLGFVFGASNDAIAKSLKALYDKIASGEPAVFADKTLFDSNGNLKVEFFNRDLKGSYIISDLLMDMRKTEERFLTVIGIPNANTDKRERLNTEEVRSNDFETRSMCEVWKDTLEESFRDANDMFGLGLKIEWREGGNINEQRNDNQPSRSV